MSGWVNGAFGALGEPMSDHLEPPRDFVDLDAVEEDAVDEGDELEDEYETEEKGEVDDEQ